MLRVLATVIAIIPGNHKTSIPLDRGQSMCHNNFSNSVSVPVNKQLSQNNKTEK